MPCPAAAGHGESKRCAAAVPRASEADAYRRLTWQHIRSITLGWKLCRSTPAWTCSRPFRWAGLAFSCDGEVVVLPVNHVMDGQDIVFRATQGSKLTAAEQQDLVSFEADHYDEGTRYGWSVLVTGRASVVYDEAESRRLGDLGLEPWVSGVPRPFWIRIRPTSVSGRRTPEPAS